MIVWLKKFPTPLDAEKVYFRQPTPPARDVAVQVDIPAHWGR